jgi:hypothetical protein
MSKKMYSLLVAVVFVMLFSGCTDPVQKKVGEVKDGLEQAGQIVENVQQGKTLLDNTLSQATPSVAPTATAEPTAEQNCSQTMVWKDGHNWVQIADYFGVTFEELAAANPTLDAQWPAPAGTTICIP